MRFAIAAAMFIGCANTNGSSDGISGQLQEFLLEDVNSTSATFGEVVSQRSYSSSTAWFFGHAT